LDRGKGKELGSGLRFSRVDNDNDDYDYDYDYDYGWSHTYN
jgi:hypothetical protein